MEALWCSTPHRATSSSVVVALRQSRAPLTRVKREVPEHKLEGLLDRCRGLEPMLTGVVHPCSANALAGAVEAAEAKLIVPVLFGRSSRRCGGSGISNSRWPRLGARIIAGSRKKPRHPPTTMLPRIGNEFVSGCCLEAIAVRLTEVKARANGFAMLRGASCDLPFIGRKMLNTTTKQYLVALTFICLLVSAAVGQKQFKPGDLVELKFEDIGCATEAMIRDLDRFMKEDNGPAFKNLVHPGACQSIDKGTVGTIKESSETYACVLPKGKSTCVWVGREILKPK